MSVDAVRAVWNYSHAKGPQRLILVVIADGINPHTECYEYGVPLIADRANYDQRFVRRKINDLIKLGELITQERPGFSNMLWLPILHGEPGYDPQECHDEAHFCNGYHTPLTMTRYAIERIGKAERRRHQKSPQPPKPDAMPETTGIGEGLLTRGEPEIAPIEAEGGSIDQGGGGLLTRGGRVYRPGGGGSIDPPNVIKRNVNGRRSEEAPSPAETRADSRGRTAGALALVPQHVPAPELTPAPHHFWPLVIDRAVKHLSLSAIVNYFQPAKLYIDEDTDAWIVLTNSTYSAQRISIYAESIAHALAAISHESRELHIRARQQEVYR